MNDMDDMSDPRVLGIESSCDETAAAVLQGRSILSNVVASQVEIHRERQRSRGWKGLKHPRL